MNSSPKQVTDLLLKLGGGDPEAMEKLLTVVYDELRRLARRYLSRERPNHTLQPTALVHEAYLKLIDQSSGVRWENRAHFFGIAANLMRQILVDHAREHKAAKRGGGEHRVTLDEALAPTVESRDVNLIALDEALNRLAKIDPQQSRIVELRYFGGLTIEETAEVTGFSAATVKREWSVARAWLYNEISRS